MTTHSVFNRNNLRLIFSLLLAITVIICGWSPRQTIGANWLTVFLLGAALVAKPFIPQRGLRRLCDLALTLVILFGALRGLEHALTYHPLGYKPGPEWQPPASGTDIWIPAVDGGKLHGWFVQATQQPATATLLYCHGNGGNLTHVGWYAEALATKGFDVLVFDYRGYGRSAGVLTDETGIYADAEAAYEYLRRERHVAPERLALYGLSLGTTAAIDLAARKPCAALVVESGLSSASELASAALPWLPSWLHWLGKNRFESAQKIAKVRCPVLITHGTSDEVIPVEQGRKLFAAAPQPKQLEIIEGGTHNLIGDQGKTYFDKVIGFLQQTLTPAKSANTPTTALAAP
jgi:uncharacterized protein